MLASTGAFFTAIDYLKDFTNADSRATFTPQGQYVRIEVSGSDCYAEYWLKTIRPLRERFCINIGELPDSDDGLFDLVEYRIANEATFVFGEHRIRVPYRTLPDLERPTVATQATMTWDRTLADHLHLVKEATAKETSRSCMDCVYIDQRAQRNSIVATDGKLMMVYSERTTTRMDAPVSILVPREHLRQFQRVCESRSKAEIGVGLNRFYVRCGRRFAIFPIRTGHFPRWEPWFIKGKSIAFDDGEATGLAIVEASQLLTACNRSAESAREVTVVSHHSGLRFISEASTEKSQQIIPSEVQNYFGPVRFQPSLLASVAKHWPQTDMRIHYRRANEPLVLTRSSGNRRLVGLLMPIC